MKIVKIKKGLDIPLEGRADLNKVRTASPDGILFGISPEDFGGYLWKACVKEGDSVKTGQPLLKAKENESLCLTSPVSGQVNAIIRGERRKILYVTVKAQDGSQQPDKFDTADLTLENLCTLLQQTGLWAMMRQRPYDIVPVCGIRPRDIFVTAFDSAPLAPGLLYDGLSEYLETGLEALKTLTDGKVYLGISSSQTKLTSRTAETIEFDGPHPAGNVGVQINAIAPVNKGDVVWTMDAATAARIGKFVKTGEVDFSCRVAITGPKAAKPGYVKTFFGASISQLTEGENPDPESTKIISGNALTGTGVKEDGYIHFPYRQLTLLASGEKADEFMGWASMSPKKFSVKRTFPAFLKGSGGHFRFDNRILGGHRAMILSGELDRVFPLDILPEYLLKAIIARDIDKMEKLGIYEVAPEDFALPEFVDTSKGELQQTVREGLDYLRKELG